MSDNARVIGVAPRDLAAGEQVTFGLFTLTMGEDVPIATFLVVDDATGMLRHPRPDGVTA